MQYELDPERSVSTSAWNTRAPQWQPIETAPREIKIDTYGIFLPHHSDIEIPIRLPNDEMWTNAPYPYTKTNFEYEDMCGRYTRTHWMHPPQPPEENP